MKKLVLIKLGGSIITDKSKLRKVNKKTLDRLVGEIILARKNFKGLLLLGHGAGSFGHINARKHKLNEGYQDGKSSYGAGLVANEVRLLNQIVVDAFTRKKLSVFPFSPAGFIFSGKKVALMLEPIATALGRGITPIVHGDVIMDAARGYRIFSTEKVLYELAAKLNKDYRIKMIYCTDTDGVYDSSGKTIARITRNNIRSLTSIKGSGQIDVTGGMLHKVEESLQIANRFGIKTLIINGNKKDNLKNAILGKKVIGTEIA